MLVYLLNKQDCPKELREMRSDGHMKSYQGALDAAIRALGTGKSIEEALLCAQDKMEKTYETSFFSYDWQKENGIQGDLRKMERAFKEIFSDGETVIANKVYVAMKMPSIAEGFLVEHMVDLILERSSGKYVAVNFHLGKGSRGPNCRSNEGLPWYDPVTVVTKGGLEEKYPGIIVWDVYLQNAKDTADAVYDYFDKSDLAVSQLKVCSYADRRINFYEDGIWDKEGFLRLAKEAFLNPGKSACTFCPNAYLCKNGVPRLEPKYEAGECGEKEPYKLPEFSEEQGEIVRHKEGPFLVIAGPGSGKTATLVGRLRYLVEECHVPPEFILAITFTNKAAGEIKERCSFLQEGEKIECCTLNALGYRILMDHAAEVGVDKFRLLTKDVSCRLIDDLLHNQAKPLQGFSYNVKYGSTGLLNTVRNRLEEYFKDADITREKYGLGDDFKEFAQKYVQTVKSGGYIGYREQITLCVKLLEEHKDILKAYQKVYWYICVDEFQDIDEQQCRLIDLLAAGRRNLMLIGDDDQSIYEWRGASPAYMLNFKERYPDGKMFFLSKNFRCTEDIVKMAATNISHDLVRFEKEIVAVKGPGAPVSIMDGENYWVPVRDIVRNLLSKGTRPDDIAVLSWSHKTLQEVAKMLPDLPLKLEGELLCRSAFFTFVKSSLLLHADLTNEKARWEYFSLFGLPMPSLKEFEERYLSTNADNPYVEPGNEECAYQCLKALMINARNNKGREYLKYAAYVSGYTFQPVLNQTIDELCVQRASRTCQELVNNMVILVNSEDETKLEAVYPDQILLSTVHVAKGREWKNVIVLDDFGDKESAAVRRLIYVALTRAEQNLFVVKLAGKRSLLVPAA